MAVPLATYQLDSSIFNPTLYKNIREYWFEGIAPDATGVDKQAMGRWMGQGTEEEKQEFDQGCIDVSKQALSAIGPESLILPEFKSHEDEKSQAEVLAAPLISEVRKSTEPPETLLSLMLLLDQMPRNSFREQSTLPLVYRHYDRLSLALLRTSLREIKEPFGHFKGRPLYSMWFLMPLMHSESVECHEEYKTLITADRKIAESKGDKGAMEIIDLGLKSEEQHSEPLRKFGRYPHRNECLGRKNTPEETEYMKTAETFGVKQAQKPDKDEL